MTEVERLARFVDQRRFEDISAEARQQLKIRVLDTVGVAIGALDAPPILAISRLVEELGGKPLSTLIGGGKTAPDRAAFFNGALSRYLDFMDSYLAASETNQVHTRLSDVAPVRDKGFDHTTQGAYAAAAGVAKALRLPPDQIANAIAIGGTANVALRVTRTGALSHWKGLAYPNTAMAATHAALLAAHGITGPIAVFEGNKGFKETISGPFEIDWLSEDLERVRLTVLKEHNAEIHAQSALDAALDIRSQPDFAIDKVRQVRLRTFRVAYQIIGGGEEGDKRTVRSKEEADHSLPYMLAVALLDGEVQPEQYAPERIAARDVQDLLRRVVVTPDQALSERFPQRMPAVLEVELDEGSVLRAARDDYRGFHTNPFDWTTARQKFDRVTRAFLTKTAADRIADVIADLDERPVSALTACLASVPRRLS
jgi:2-methylcitrate dehydratase